MTDILILPQVHVNAVYAGGPNCSCCKMNEGHEEEGMGVGDG